MTRIGRTTLLLSVLVPLVVIQIVLLACSAREIVDFLVSLDHCESCIRPNDGVGPVESGWTSLDELLVEWPDAHHIHIHSSTTEPGRIVWTTDVYYPQRGVRVRLSGTGNRPRYTADRITLHEKGEDMRPIVGAPKQEIKAERGFTGKTGGGVGIGSSKKEVESYFGGPPVDSNDVFNYAYAGVTFGYDDQGRVSGMLIDRFSE